MDNKFILDCILLLAMFLIMCKMIHILLIAIKDKSDLIGLVVIVFLIILSVTIACLLKVIGVI